MKIIQIKTTLSKVRSWLKKPIQQQVQSFSRRYYVIEDLFFTRKYHLDFNGYIPCSELSVDSDFSKKNATAYQAYGSYYLKSLLRHAISMEKQPKYFIDVGCGKGKQCIYAIKYFNFETVIGIDFSRELIDIANQNVSNLNYENVELCVADAMEWKLPNEYCFIFFYNPFSEVILHNFILNNIDHFKNNGSVVCYAGDHYRKVLTDFGFDTIYRDHESNSIYKFI